MANPNIWHFECFRAAAGGAPWIIIERGFIPRQLATPLNVRALLKSRCEDRSYADRHGGRRPDAVRFLDHEDQEFCRYTLTELLTDEPAMPDRDPYENGSIAFRKGRPRDTWQYFEGTDEWQAWLDGWDAAKREGRPGLSNDA